MKNSLDNFSIQIFLKKSKKYAQFLLFKKMMKKFIRYFLNGNFFEKWKMGNSSECPFYKEKCVP